MKRLRSAIKELRRACTGQPHALRFACLDVSDPREERA
jgi:hypothetical protein